MRQFYAPLKYLLALEVIGFMIDRGLACTVEPIGNDRYRVLFPEGHGEAARAKLKFLKTMPLQTEALLSEDRNLVVSGEPKFPSP